MALSEEEKRQAEDLLSINERRLRVRDRQIERYGDNAAPEIILDAEELRRKIMALKAVLEPELPDEISGLVKRRLEDDYFIFQQTLGAKQDVALLRDDVTQLKTQSAMATTARMQIDERLGRIEERQAESERKRRKWQPINFGLLALIAAVILIAVLFGRVYL